MAVAFEMITTKYWGMGVQNFLKNNPAQSIFIALN
jgi:hypothetical protein